MTNTTGLPPAFFKSALESLYTSTMVATLRRVLQRGDSMESSVVALFAAFVGACQAAEMDAETVFQQLLARTESARAEIAAEKRQGVLSVVH